ncbi:MAG TPA: Tim44/TimA family putative adaptor protein [Stellaceae bacterium]|nr:Tim44/TimA family putative adaptor protein [Stellaceae bacterium]
MGDGYQFIDIIVFAVIAGLLVLRLRSVLGRRTGTEQRREPFQPPAGETPAEKVVALPPRGRVTSPATPPEAPAPLALGLGQLRDADRSFDEKRFLTGARAAFEIIVNAFAKGDTAALQPLLSPDVFASFANAIRTRQAQHETLTTNLLSIKTIEIAEAGLDGDTAHVTVRFVSDQTHVTRAADGSVVEGNPDQVEEKTDLWTFARPVRSRDPNWTLVATHSS